VESRWREGEGVANRGLGGQNWGVRPEGGSSPKAGGAKLGELEVSWGQTGW